MEECKELFQNKDSLSDEKLISQIKEKLEKKLKQIKEMSSELSEEEAIKMISLLEKRMDCLDRCKRLFTRGSLSTDKSTSQ
ncbi:hypothetical protein NEAUS04_0499 [Nematocida ausubeli]|nr:hypothetical protein NEAUS06_0641 [Nematocida ausubeli]KAI5134144.1 hypothetical protein NEAUS07_0718 [Nematocida ausubeli]KAI5147324.1 hypothetical protein NEAUS05_0635 [Nematocida ausubeli]KAI5161409.1 hypothetical protein NEAUS04_0499 [Nematocida ausubeli]